MKTYTPALLLAVGLVGCATSNQLKFKGLNKFPAKQKLATIAADPAPDKVLGTVEVDKRVPTWTLTGPLPDMIGPVPRQPANELERMVAEKTAVKERGVFTEQMHCAAREVGAFALVHGGYPWARLRSWIEDRCGVTSTVGFHYVFWDRESSLEDLLKQVDTTKRIAEIFDKLLEGTTNPETGTWFGSGNGKSVLVVAAGRRNVDLQPMSPATTPEGEFQLQGTLLIGDELVSASVNKGKFGVEGCHSLGGVKPPQFRLRCQAAKEDEEARFSVASRRDGDVLGFRRLQQSVYPTGRRSLEYVDDQAPGFIAPDAAPTTEDGDEIAQTEDPTASPPVEFDASTEGLRRQLLTRINAERAKAGLGPVEIDLAQTKAADGVVDHYFQADREDDRDTLDDIARGLLAGWDVEGQVVHGTFVSRTSVGTPDDLVRSMTEEPSGRHLLFAPDVSRVTISTVYEEPVIATLIYGYEQLRQETHKERYRRFLQYVKDARAALGNDGPKVIAQMREFNADLAAKVERGEMAFEEAAEQVARKTQKFYPTRRVYYLPFRAHNPQEVTLPDDILHMQPLNVSVMVAAYKPTKYPWYIYGVIIAYPEFKMATKVADASGAQNTVTE